ncbi:hypothetical protein [Erythrobacter sp. HL-111]|uniref:hypothetical protein n=1 Tax=Erythrobacter sp. HL-111 TaxID=1798193 RepID=UPI0006DA623D|nr:hypothetical protein [Erythrobacter sp. HL-111]KPP95462.1 MAG: hypothetical protein HLUCCO15_02285 [Erythrobacteraceae bacterium HL-111]
MCLNTGGFPWPVTTGGHSGKATAICLHVAPDASSVVPLRGRVPIASDVEPIHPASRQSGGFIALPRFRSIA